MSLLLKLKERFSNKQTELNQAVNEYTEKIGGETMKRKKIEKIFKKSIEVYGKEAQSRQAMEECAELVQAINKCLRYPNKDDCKDNLVEEIADVEIMLFQLKEMFYINETEVHEWKEKKAKREKERLKNVINKGDIND